MEESISDAAKSKAAYILHITANEKKKEQEPMPHTDACEEDNDPFDVIGLRRAASLAPVAPINFGIELSEPSIDEPPGVVLGRFLGKVRVS